MTATISSASTTAALRIRYKDGVDKLDYDDKPTLFKMAPREEDFKGESYVFALNVDGTQGVAPTITEAQANLAQSPNYRYTVTRVRYYSLARVSGEAQQAAQGAGAMLNLWEHEVERATYMINRELAFQFWRSGNGVRGTISASATVASDTLLLSDPEEAAYFSVGMRVVASATAGSALLPGVVVVSSVDRVTGTVKTAGGNWSTQIAGLAVSHKLYRYGDAPDGGTNKLLTGVAGWIDQGASALFGLSAAQRGAAAAQLGGQLVSASGVPLEELGVDLSNRLLKQGARSPDLLVLHPNQGAKVRKALIGRSSYNRIQVKSAVANISFKGFEVDGAEGNIATLEDITCPDGSALMTRKATWRMHTLGKCPQILNFDKQEMLRVATDDAYEIRIGMYGQAECRIPHDSVLATSVGS